MNEKIIFKEAQRFNQWWLMTGLISLNGLFLFAIYSQFIMEKPLGDRPMSDASLIIVTIVNILITVLFFLVRLDTIINEQFISVRFFPFFLKPKIILKADIKSVFVREYKPLIEYGGWGIKGSANNRAYNVSGKVGLQIILKDDKKILIGTNRKTELEELLKIWIKN